MGLKTKNLKTAFFDALAVLKKVYGCQKSNVSRCRAALGENAEFSSIFSCGFLTEPFFFNFIKDRLHAWDHRLVYTQSFFLITDGDGSQSTCTKIAS